MSVMPDGAAAAALASHQKSAAHGSRLALSDAKRHLQKSTLKLAGYAVAAYLVLRLVPTLEKALHSLEHVSWEWLVPRHTCSYATAAATGWTSVSRGRSLEAA